VFTDGGKTKSKKQDSAAASSVKQKPVTSTSPLKQAKKLLSNKLVSSRMNIFWFQTRYSPTAGRHTPSFLKLFSEKCVYMYLYLFVCFSAPT